MRQIRKIGCLCIFVVMIMLAFGCSESPSPTATGSEMTTSTYPSDPTVPTDTVSPGPTLAISDTEGRLLSYHGTPAPVFAYNQEHGELLAYCFEEGSSHLPYVLGGDGEREDPACSFYIPDYDRTVSVLFDSESGVWRVFSESLDSLKVVDSEWIVYNDRAYIADRAADLKREVSEGAKPRYYSVESGLYYFFTDGGLTLAIDMNGDGATEMVNVFATQSKKSKTMDCSVRLNGEEGLVIKGVLSFSGAYVTDIDESDGLREIVFEYENSGGESVSQLIRYDGNSIRSRVFLGSVDCAGDGKVYHRPNNLNGDGDKRITYTVDHLFEFSEV